MKEDKHLLKKWMEKRIKSEMLKDPKDIFDRVQLGGKLRAYKEILEYINKH